MAHRGHATRVPWASQCGAIAFSRRATAIASSRSSRRRVRLSKGHNVAGSRATIWCFSGVNRCRRAYRDDFDALHALGAVMRSAQMAGALQDVLETTVQYARERVQFGRPIGASRRCSRTRAAGRASRGGDRGRPRRPSRRGAIRRRLVQFAGDRGGENPVRRGGRHRRRHRPSGARRDRFTQEHRLHYSTRRLWSWRDEFGNEAYWSAPPGPRGRAAGADRLWHAITAAG
jgi:acyl-CoA dehydrogenase